MTRANLVCDTTLGEFTLAYHVEAATKAVSAAEIGDVGAARAWGHIARKWLKDYIASK